MVRRRHDFIYRLSVLEIFNPILISKNVKQLNKISKGQIGERNSTISSAKEI